MDWRNWRTWGLLAVIIVAIFAIYGFASSGDEAEATTSPTQVVRVGVRTQAQGRDSRGVPTGPLEPIRVDLLEPQSGSYRIDRNLFTFVEPPPPPPPKPPEPVVPPDKDKDGVPDFQDNCPDLRNPDQSDIDRDGIGSDCETTLPEIPPPPPPPVPPDFTYKYIGSFGTASRPIAAFSKDGEIVNVRAGETFAGKFVLKHIGIESVDIGFVGFPPDVTKRIPVGQ